MSYLLPPGRLDKELIFDFFWKFSVFECALKREGFLRKDRESAQPDWKDFVGTVGSKFDTVRVAGFRESVSTLRRLAPQKQFNRGQKLEWEPRVKKSKESDAEYTIELLKIARNNLFHGGKYPDGGDFDVARNREILHACVTILDGLYELHPGISHWIDEAVAS